MFGCYADARGGHLKYNEAMWKNIKHEPLAVIALLLAIILHITPSFSDLRSLLAHEEDDILLGFECTGIDKPYLKRFQDIGLDGAENNQYAMLAPVDCLLINRSKYRIRIVSADAVLLDDMAPIPLRAETRYFRYSMVGRGVDVIKELNLTFPIEIEPNESYKYRTVTVIPITTVYDTSSKNCIDPDGIDVADLNNGFCLNGQPYPFGNYANLSIEKPLMFSYDGYGQRVVISHGYEAIFRHSGAVGPFICEQNNVWNASHYSDHPYCRKWWHPKAPSSETVVVPHSFTITDKALDPNL